MNENIRLKINKKNKTKVNSNKKTKPKVRFIVEREYTGTKTFEELFEPLLEMMIREKYKDFA